MNGISFPWDLVVKNQRIFEKLNNETYLITGMLLVFSLLMTYLVVTYMISNQPRNVDFTQRKIAALLIGLGVVLFLVFYNWLVVSPYIKVPLFYAKFIALASFGTVWQCVLIYLLLYTLILFVLAKALPNKPINTLFARRNK